LSEESDGITYEDRSMWRTYWLVDPLDGTKEFVKGSGEFTVNIALMHENQPVLGVVHTPVKEWMHWGVHSQGAWKQVGTNKKERIQAQPYSGGNMTVVASKSHGQDKLEQFLSNVQETEGSYDVTNMGSALKICLVAEGIGDNPFFLAVGAGEYNWLPLLDGIDLKP